MDLVRSNCEKCSQAVWLVRKSLTSVVIALDIAPERRAVLNGEGRIQIVDTYTLHNESCPKIEKRR